MPHQPGSHEAQKKQKVINLASKVTAWSLCHQFKYGEWQFVKKSAKRRQSHVSLSECQGQDQERISNVARVQSDVQYALALAVALEKFIK